MTRNDWTAIFVLIAAIIFFTIKLCGAETLNYYILSFKLFTGPIKTALKSKEMTDIIQPFRGKIILFPSNTNYLLTNIEPENAPPVIRPFFSLYQSYEFDGRAMKLVIDNSDTFDVNEDWSVKTSS